MRPAALDLFQILPLMALALPFLGAAIVSALPGMRTVWAVAIAFALATLALALVVALPALGGAPVLVQSPTAGGVPWLRLDTYGALGLIVAAALGLIACTAGLGVSVGPDRIQVSPFVAALLLVLSGALAGLVVIEGAAALLGFGAMATLAVAGLVVADANARRPALPAAFEVIVWGGTLTLLAGLGLVLALALTSSVDLGGVVAAATRAPPDPSLLGALALVVVGALALSGTPPGHSWAVNAATLGAPAGAVLVGPGLQLAGLFILAKLVGTLGTVGGAVLAGWMGLVLGSVIAVAVVLVAIQAAMDEDVRRMLGLLAAAQGGLAALLIVSGTDAGLRAGLFQALAVCLVAATAALATASLAARGHVRTLDDLDGMGAEAPISTLALLLAGLAVIGMPLTVGFVAKWRLIEAALISGWWWAAAVVVVVALAGIIAVGRMVDRLLLRPLPAARSAAAPEDAAASTALPMLALAGLSVLLGIDATGLWDLVVAASASLTEGTEGLSAPASIPVPAPALAETPPTMVPADPAASGAEPGQ